MKVLKKESEAVQQVAREAIALLKQAYEKLDEAYDNEGVMQVNTMEAAECVIHAGVAIETAAAWLNFEEGAEYNWCHPSPEVQHDGTDFDF